ncbi:MAG: hypothetical protein HYR60_14930 [Acidobacteria bacterium]|nr:hypothetical protein [Acidobacteriota bacterium]
MKGKNRDKALAAHGLARYETEGADTALGGSRADQWAANHKEKLDKVHLCIGGNDFLRFASTTGLSKLTAEQRQAQWVVIRKDIQAVVDDILVQRPDHLDPALMAKVYKTGFEGAFFGVSAKIFNAALVELGREKLAIAKKTPRCFYAQNWGLLQHRYGAGEALKPLAVRLPGGPPDHDPYPGGDLSFTSGAAMPDGVHPTPDGFQLIFENAVRQFYGRWLRE